MATTATIAAKLLSSRCWEAKVYMCYVCVTMDSPLLSNLQRLTKVTRTSEVPYNREEQLIKFKISKGEVNQHMEYVSESRKGRTLLPLSCSGFLSKSLPWIKRSTTGKGGISTCMISTRMREQSGGAYLGRSGRTSVCSPEAKGKPSRTTEEGSIDRNDLKIHKRIRYTGIK